MMCSVQDPQAQSIKLNVETILHNLQQLFFSQNSLAVTFRALLQSCKNSKDPVCAVAAMLLQQPLRFCVNDNGLIPFDNVNDEVLIPYKLMNRQQLTFLYTVIESMKSKKNFVGWSSMHQTFNAMLVPQPETSDTDDDMEKIQRNVSCVVYADAVGVIAQVVCIAHTEYKKLGFAKASEAERAILARICACVNIPPHVLVQASLACSKS